MEMEMEMATTEKPLAFLPFLLIKLYLVPFLWIGNSLGRELACFNLGVRLSKVPSGKKCSERRIIHPNSIIPFEGPLLWG